MTVVYLKQLTMAIAMVGGGDDTGGSGYRDRLGKSERNEERSERGRKGVGKRVAGNETIGAASQEKRRKTGSVRGWREQRDRDGAEERGAERRNREKAAAPAVAALGAAGCYHEKQASTLIF